MNIRPRNNLAQQNRSQNVVTLTASLPSKIRREDTSCGEENRRVQNAPLHLRCVCSWGHRGGRRSVNRRPLFAREVVCVTHAGLL